MAEPSDLVSQEHLDALCVELRAVIADAEAAGNPVAETWTGFGDAVRLRRPRPVLLAIGPAERAALTYTIVDDPHYWLGEIHCRRHPGWFIVLPFGPGIEQPDPPDLPITS